jgi:hypothetical protein
VRGELSKIRIIYERNLFDKYLLLCVGLALFAWCFGAIGLVEVVSWGTA